MSLNKPPNSDNDREDKLAGKAGGGPAGFKLLALIEGVALPRTDQEVEPLIVGVADCDGHTVTETTAL